MLNRHMHTYIYIHSLIVFNKKNNKYILIVDPFIYLFFKLIKKRAQALLNY